MKQCMKLLSKSYVQIVQSVNIWQLRKKNSLLSILVSLEFCNYINFHPNL